MKQFHNILFVSNGINEETDTLRHAIRLAVWALKPQGFVSAVRAY